MDKLNQILQLVKEYTEEKRLAKKWAPEVDWVHYSGPYFGSEEITSAISTLLKGWLVLGTDGVKFEKQFSPLLGKPYGVVTNSGSSSNLLMVSALLSKNLYNFPRGTGVVVPIAGFPTTLNPIIQNGLVPAFVDIELDTLNINIDDIDVAIEGLKPFTPVKAITFAHVLGNPPDMDKLMSVVNRHNLVLLEDCCDALGSTYNGKPLGSFGDMSSCSFYPAHHITMGEGGFVACKNREIEKVIRSLRDWGRGCYCVGEKANLSKKGTCGCRFKEWLPAFPNEMFDHKYVYEEIGYNLKPIELQCSMGLAQLNRLPEIVAKRIENYNNLMEIFRPYEDHFILPRATPKSSPSWFAFPLTIKNGAKFKRFDFCGYLEDHKIQTRNYFGGNLMLQPAYQHHAENICGVDEFKKYFPNATKATTDTFFMGTSPVITDSQMYYIGKIVKKFFEKI